MPDHDMPDDFRDSDWEPSAGDREVTATLLSVRPSTDHGSAAAAGQPAPARYVGRRRALVRARRHRQQAPAAPRRIALVAAAVATVMLGTGALAKTLPLRPIGLPVLAPAADPPDAAPQSRAPAEAAAPGAVPSAPPPTGGPAAVAVAVAPAPAPPRLPIPTEEPPPPPTAAPAPESVTIVYEAEEADLSGFVRLFQVADASGGTVVGMIGLHVSNHVRFSEVTVDTAGAYELTLYYASAPERQGMVSVNDGELVAVEFPALDDGREVGSVSIPVELAAGPNAIWFGNADGPAPALDRITVTG